MRQRVSVTGFFFDVAAKLEAHGGKNFTGKVVFAAGREALVERSAEDRSGRGGFNGSEDGPAALPGIGDAARVTLESGLLEERDGGEVEQPGSNHGAAAPDFGDIGEIEVILIMLGIAKRRGFRIGFALLFADVGVFEDVEALGVGGNEAVLDAVVNHFDEVAGAIGAAVEIAVFSSAGGLFAARGARNIAAAGSQSF